MYERARVLAGNLASVTGERKKRRARALRTDRTLQLLVADLVAARTAAGTTQEAVAARMWTIPLGERSLARAGNAEMPPVVPSAVQMMSSKDAALRSE